MNLYKKNVSLLSILIILTLLSNFLFYRISHIFLQDDESYGIWLVILSIIAWFYIMDFGISNSLRNLLTDAREKQNLLQQKKLITTTYIIMLMPLFALLTIAILMSQAINWHHMLNITNKPNVNKVINISFIMFPFIFYLNTISYIYHAFFKSYLVSLLQFLNLFINCIVVYILHLLNYNSLLIMAFTYFSINIIIYLIATIIFFYTNRELTISIKYFDRTLIKNLLGVGISFFFLDITSILLFNSGPLFIAYFFRPEVTLEFQLPYKLLSVFVTLVQIILTPLWTLIITKLSVKDIDSIKRVHNKILKIIVLISILILLLSNFVNIGIEIWIGKNYHISQTHIYLIALIIILSIICRMYQTLLNAMTSIKIQVYIYILAVLTSITLMYILIENYNFGLMAFIFSIALGLIFPAIILPIVFIKNINRLERN